MADMLLPSAELVRHSAVSISIRVRAAEQPTSSDVARCLWRVYLLCEMAPKQAGSLGRIVWLNLHGHCISPFGSVHWLVVQLHAGNAANLNAALAGNAYWSSHLCMASHLDPRRISP